MLGRLFQSQPIKSDPVEQALPFNVWLVQQDRSREQRRASGMREGVYHSQKMPPELARRMLEHARLPPTARVLDPFLGTGTTLVEAARMGIQGLVGCDTQPEYIEKCARPNLVRAGVDLFDIRVGNASAMDWVPDASIDLVVGSPPYGSADPLVDSSGRCLVERSAVFFHDFAMNRTSFHHKPPEAAAGSLSGTTPDDWRAGMTGVLRECRRVLKHGAFAMLAAREYWDDRGMIDLPGWIMEIAPAAGLIVYDQVYAIEAAMDQHGAMTSRASVHRHRLAHELKDRSCSRGIPCVTRVVILRRRPLRLKKGAAGADRDGDEMQEQGGPGPDAPGGTT